MSEAFGLPPEQILTSRPARGLAIEDVIASARVRHPGPCLFHSKSGARSIRVKGSELPAESRVKPFRLLGRAPRNVRRPDQFPSPRMDEILNCDRACSMTR